MSGAPAKPVRIERLRLDDDGLVPNNPRLPLTVYRSAISAGRGDAEQRCIALFAGNGWGSAWVNGIYPFHHYHATAHEVLGLVRGWAEVQFGGPAGPVLRVEAGDIVMIPPGVGHCRVDASDDLSVVGAYPGPGEVAVDLQRATPDARLASLPLIARVPDPQTDPVLGMQAGVASLDKKT